MIHPIINTREETGNRCYHFMLKLSEDEEIELQLSCQINLRSQSQTKKPLRSDDYVMKTESFTCEKNPETYQEAIENQEHKSWRKTMENKMTSLKQNQTRE
ncbi:hypothetical protein CEXT_723271 [Caerostris extrusa]|uniref:Uncharacterized protein n=1 Tax=Caerostris extrusa TaxID=172846 RepID=A0AAV4XLB8_CAEEX|nr:hypothetical protein CEXT_723271 [Caerostris extrusa]